MEVTDKKMQSFEQFLPQTGFSVKSEANTVGFITKI
jgi:hypothetical protein